ncbi:hypothetical protein [Afipia sp. Root123D2]|uniref:hypothetical protein n=1 Tax=Afipia sp. Root123D2 TaxID=1736436 RepID=UPI000AA60024|nr:hypothetical protein [Afipia sp. Root123D2]
MTPSVARAHRLRRQTRRKYQTVLTHPELPVHCRAIHASAIAITGASTFTTRLAKYVIMVAR